jgi:hypothetical protein
MSSPTNPSSPVPGTPTTQHIPATQETFIQLMRSLIQELQVLTGGLKQDLAYRRVSKFQGLEFKKVTATATPQFLEFTEPLTQLSVAVASMGAATTIYVAIEGTAGTDTIELNSSIRILSFGDIPVKRISVMTDSGSDAVVQVFGLRGG